MLLAVYQQLLLKMLICPAALKTKESLASNTRGQQSVQLNKSWLWRWPVIQGCEGVGVILWVVSKDVLSIDARFLPVSQWNLNAAGTRPALVSTIIKTSDQTNNRNPPKPVIGPTKYSAKTSRLIIYKLMMYRTYFQNLRSAHVSTSVTCLREK